jgi:hypothetical protein
MSAPIPFWSPAMKYRQNKYYINALPKINSDATT